VCARRWSACLYPTSKDVSLNNVHMGNLGKYLLRKNKLMATFRLVYKLTGLAFIQLLAGSMSAFGQ